MNIKEQNKKLLSPFIVDQIPAYVSLTFGDSTVEGGALFTRFVQLYYEWLEKSYVNSISSYGNRSIAAYADRSVISFSNPSKPEIGNPYDRLKRLRGFRDIDNTIEPLVKHFTSEFMPDLPFDIAADKLKLLKRMKEIYTLRGTVDGFNALFSSIFGKSAKLYFPRDFKLFSPSSSLWKSDTVIRVVIPGGIDTTKQTDYSLSPGYYAVGETTGVKITVGKVDTNTYIGNTNLCELYVDRSTLSNESANLIPLTTEKYSDFLHDEYLKFIDSEGVVVNNSSGNPLRAKIKSSITGVAITSEGSGYKIDDDITFGGTNDGISAEVNTLSPGVVEEIIIDDYGTGYSTSAGNPEIVFVSRYFELYGDLSYDGTNFQGFTAGSTLVGDDSGATANIRLREGNRVYVDNISGIFTTDEISKTDYGSEIVRTSGHVDTFTEGAATGWADGTYYDLFQTGTDKDGTGLILTLVVSSESATATIVNSGSGYIATEEVTFTEPGDTNTVVITIDGVKEYTARLDKLVEIGSADGGGNVTSASSSTDPRYRYIQNWSLDDGGSGYIETPPAYVLNEAGISTAKLSTFGSHIGGIKSVKINGYGLGDETTTVQFRDTAEKNIYVAANTSAPAKVAVTVDNFRIGDEIYQGSSFGDSDATGLVVGSDITEASTVPQYNIIKVINSTGDWGANKEVKNTRSGAIPAGTTVKTVPSGAIAKFQSVYDVTGLGWLSNQSGASPSSALTSSGGSGFAVTYDTPSSDYRLYLGTSRILTLAAASSPGDLSGTITGETSTETATVIEKVSDTEYLIDSISGTFLVGEGVDDGTDSGTVVSVSNKFTDGATIWRGIAWTNNAYAYAVITDITHQNDVSNPYIKIDFAREAGVSYTPPVYGFFVKGSIATLTLSGASTPSDLTGAITSSGGATATVVEKINSYTYHIGSITGTFSATETVTDSTNNSGAIEYAPLSHIYEAVPSDRIGYDTDSTPPLVGLNNTGSSPLKVLLDANGGDGDLLGAWTASNTYSGTMTHQYPSVTNGSGATFTAVTDSSGQPTFTIETTTTDAGGTNASGTGYAVGDILYLYDPDTGASQSTRARLKVTDIETTTTSVKRAIPADIDNFKLSEFADTLTVSAGTTEAHMGSGFLTTDTPILTDQATGSTATQALNLITVPQDGTSVPEGNVNEQATGTVEINAIVDKVGVHESRSAQLNEESKISDGLEYQTWSYGIQTSVNPEKWLGIAKDLFHPAGMTVIPIYTIDSENSSSATSSSKVS